MGRVVGRTDILTFIKRLWERLFVQGCTYVGVHMDVQTPTKPRTTAPTRHS